MFYKCTGGLSLFDRVVTSQAAKETADLIKKKGEFNKMRSSSQLLRRSSDKMMPMIDKRSG